MAGANLVATKTDLVKALAEGSLADGLTLAQTCVDRAKTIADQWAQTDQATSRPDLNRRAMKLVLWMILLAIDDAVKLSLVPRDHLANADQVALIERLTRRLGPDEAVERIGDGFEALRWIEASVGERLVFERLLLRMLGPGIMTGL